MTPMKKQTFIKSVHKALRDGGIKRGAGRDGVRYEVRSDNNGMSIEAISSFNSSISRRYEHMTAIVKALESAGIVINSTSGIVVDIKFSDNGVED